MHHFACLLLLITTFGVVEPFFFIVESLWTIYEITSEFYGYASGAASNADVMDSLVGLKTDINQVTKDVTTRIDQLYQQLIVQLPRVAQINRRLEAFSRRFNRISYLYRIFERIINPTTKQPNERALKEFSTVALGIFSDSVDATLDALHELFIPTEIGHLNDGLLTLLVKNLPQKSSNVTKCNAGSSPEEQFFLLYMALLTAEVRGFMMLAFTYRMLQDVTGEDYSEDIRAGRITTMTRVQEYMWELRDSVNWSSSVYFPCDPPNGYRKGVTFAEFTMFRSLYAANQYSIYPECAGLCEELDFAAARIKCAREDRLCQIVGVCTGQIKQCISFNRRNSEICMNVNSTIGSKRYSYVANGRDMILGSKSDCERDYLFELQTFSKYSDVWKRSYNCDYCLCTCIEDTGPKSYAFNLRPQLSDIDDNKIVSGIKFTMASNVVHLQIQQGTSQNDKIASNTLQWKPIDVMERDTTKTDAAPSYYDQNGQAYTEEVDFTRLTLDHRDFYLDDLVVPDGYVVTGVRLNRPSFDERAIQLEIRGTPYNFTNGKVIVSEDQPSVWITPWDMKNVLPEYSSPVRQFLLAGGTGMGEVGFWDSTEVISKPYTWITVVNSNPKLDIAGVVFPVLDIREVTPPQPFLLQGINLMYKQPEHTMGPGYLAFSLRSVSRRRFLEGEITMD